MLGLAASLGCPAINGAPDTACLCSNVAFGYGIRDCSAQACPAGTDLASIYSYGVGYCAAGESRILERKK